MEFDFLTPLILEDIYCNNEDIYCNNKEHQLIHTLSIYTKNAFPDIKNATFAIIGVLENRGNLESSPEVNLNHIRKEFYKLYPGNWNAKIVDLGNLPSGNTINDTYFALSKILSKVIKNKTIPIIIGGSQDLTYAMYRAYDTLEQMVNLVSVDASFDIGKDSDPIHSNSYLSKIIMDAPNNLFNFSNIGFQTYYNSQEEIDLVEKLFFEVYRLGEISNNSTLAEPVFRDADIVSLDLNAIQSSSSGNFDNFQPNGFNGKEICTLARYAGISDKVSSLGIFNHNSTKKESIIIAQILWYFIEGYHHRLNEYPFGSRKNYIKYNVPVNEEIIVFFKSNTSDRWWMEIPFFGNTNNKNNKTTLLPCSYSEYLEACNQTEPERYFKAIRKSII